MHKFRTLFIVTISRLWLAMLLALLVAGMFLVPSAVAQGGENPTLTIVAPALNVRSGPGVNNPAFDFLLQDDQVAVISYDKASDWWQVRLPNGSTGWVSGGSEYVSVSGDVSGLPVENAQIVSNSESSPTQNSPSVETIVFQTAVGGPIYAINADGSNLHYLTTGLDPILSPDGQWVAFARWNTSQDGSLGSLSVINVDGTGERVILNDIFNPRSPTWSQDGTQIVISMQQGGRVQPERTCGNERPTRGSEDIQVTREGGKVKFCYTRPPDPHWGLRLINVITGAFEDLPHDTYSVSPTWDPVDSQRIVYDGNRGLMNLDMNLRMRVPLTNDFNDRSPVFSPDGSKIAVSYWQHDHWEVQVMNADGSGRVRLTETSYKVFAEQALNGEPFRSFNNAAPTWSPDGSQIAFLTDRTGQWEIWVMNADGSDQRPLIPAETLAGIGLQYNGVNERVLSWR